MLNTVSILKTVSEATKELDIPYVIVGVKARDLVLHYGHGARIERATRDIDFALEVSSWEAFEALKKKLLNEGFKTVNANHRLISPENSIVDIVPFGGIANEQSAIAWPPKGKTIMNVLGFQEACDSAEWVRIKNDFELDVPVATPAGMMLLELISWTDRARDLRKKYTGKDKKEAPSQILHGQTVGKHSVRKGGREKKATRRLSKTGYLYIYRLTYNQLRKSFS